MEIARGLATRQQRAAVGLFQGRVDRRELGVQLGAKAVYDRNDGERDTRCYQAILDGGGGRLVTQESLDGSHRLSPGPKCHSEMKSAGILLACWHSFKQNFLSNS